MTSLLDPYIPVFDILERHSIRIHAPPERVFAAACDIDIDRIWLSRMIFRLREFLFGSHAPEPNLPQGFIAKMKALGWGVLSEAPGRAIVMGAVTQPWEANVRFRAITPAEFARNADPGLVKIAWSLWVEAEGTETVLRTETRAVATEGASRRRFRKYWWLVSPGIRLIRRAILRSVRTRVKLASETAQGARSGN